VTNEPDADGLKRTLVLDNLIHGYFILGRPDRLDYELRAHLRPRRAPRGRGEGEGRGQIQRLPGALEDPLPRRRRLHIPALHAVQVSRDRRRRRRDRSRHHPRQQDGPGPPSDTTIQTTWGDARQFVEKNQNVKKYDIVFGDAFNDFSVPWHLTTREFNDKLAKMLDDDGVYMINIIDAYESDEMIVRKAEKRITKAESGEKSCPRPRRADFLEEKGRASSQRLGRGHPSAKADERIAKEEEPKVLSEAEKGVDYVATRAACVPLLRLPGLVGSTPRG